MSVLFVRRSSMPGGKSWKMTIQTFKPLILTTEFEKRMFLIREHYLTGTRLHILLRDTGTQKECEFSM